MREHVLVVIKPDCLQRGLTGHVIQMFSHLGLKLTAAKALRVTEELAKKHYQHLQDEPFFSDLIALITGKMHGTDKVLAFIYSGEDAIAKCRELAGATNPEEAHPRSIRGCFGRITTKGIFENVVHVSSDKEEAAREIKLWFSPEQIEEEILPTKEGTLEKKTKTIWA